MTTGDWREEAKKAVANDKEVIINGVCVMNQSSDYKSDEEGDANNEQEDEDDAKLTVAEGNDEDSIKKSFIKKPSLEKSSESADDLKVKKEVDEAGAWEY